MNAAELSTPTMSAGVREFLLAFADDEHFMGQQHTEWIGVAPFLEEDVAFASIAQDELGHASLLYSLVAGDDDAYIDMLAYDRGASEYRSAWLVEQPFTDWASALVRHWLYDSAEVLRWGLVANSSLIGLAHTVDRALSEELFHRRHADALLNVLLANHESRERLLAVLPNVLSLAVGLFDPVAGEDEAIAEGVVSGSFASQFPAWKAGVDERFGAVNWAQIAKPDQHNRTRRSEPFTALLSRMREVIDLDPHARW
jgi:ring-1,2-phenylacetyl-CoA epoxidase subunit PaaC